MRYLYLGDRLTDPRLVGQPCDPIRRSDGRVVVGSGKGTPRNQLVKFSSGELVVVPARRLRLNREAV
jgi:hypothetical protein